MTLQERENTIYKSRKVSRAPKQLCCITQQDCDVASICNNEEDTLCSE
jgi:hypothetical protein